MAPNAEALSAQLRAERERHELTLEDLRSARRKMVALHDAIVEAACIIDAIPNYPAAIRGALSEHLREKARRLFAAAPGEPSPVALRGSLSVQTDRLGPDGGVWTAPWRPVGDPSVGVHRSNTTPVQNPEDTQR